MATAAGAGRRFLAAASAITPATLAAALTAIALSRGRSVIHSSSPSTARVDHARLCRGTGKTIGFTAIQAATRAAWLQRRFHTGTNTSGVLAHRVQALQGLECLANTCRLIAPNRDMVSLPSCLH